MDLLTELAILVLAAFVGFEVISKVPNTLHTPLMSATNAIHGIVLLGAILVIGPADGFVNDFLLVIAIALMGYAHMRLLPNLKGDNLRHFVIHAWATTIVAMTPLRDAPSAGSYRIGADERCPRCHETVNTPGRPPRDAARR